MLLLVTACASAPDRPAAGRDVEFERARVDGTLARIVDLARAGKTSRELHERYGEHYVTALEDSELRVTVWAEPEREATFSLVAAAIERVGGVVLEGNEGVVRARLSLPQVGELSRDTSVRKLRLARHHDPIR